MCGRPLVVVMLELDPFAWLAMATAVRWDPCDGMEFMIGMGFE